MQVAGLVAGGLSGLVSAASAQVHDADVGINQSYQQTSDLSADLQQADFSARAFYFGATDYTAPGTLTIPGPDTRPLIDQGYSTPELGYQQTFINGAASLTDAQAVYQTGTYAFDLPAGAQPDASFSINYTGNAFPNVPLVTNLSTLQSLNAADSVTFDLNGMTASPNATDFFIFFFVYNSTTNALAYSSGTLPDTTTDIVVPGGILAAGQGYYFNLLYSDRIVSTDDITLTQFYDIDTAGNFATTAGTVPEASTWAMMLLGFAGTRFRGLSQVAQGRPRLTAAPLCSCSQTHPGQGKTTLEEVGSAIVDFRSVHLRDLQRPPNVDRRHSIARHVRNG